MRILGIESSCDETAAAIIEGHGEKIRVISSVVASQINIHKKYGGVIPEVAAREHVLKIIPVINKTLSSRKTGIDAIAVANGPGLITSLMIGVETAKTLSYAWNVPLVAVNHLEGHIYANYIRKIPDSHDFPAIVLIVSGGHTSLVLMTGHGKYKTVGETVDDAAGEAFDKAARLLGVGYPGGPEISKQAENYNNSKINRPAGGNDQKLNFPRPMIKSSNFDFSFSGLKTALLYKLRSDKNWKSRVPEYADEFQQAVIDVLVAKTIRATKQYQAKSVMLAGGVSANKKLRFQMEGAISSILPKSRLRIPDPKLCTDNAAMIAAAGYFKAKNKKFTAWRKIKTDCNARLE